MYRLSALSGTFSRSYYSVVISTACQRCQVRSHDLTVWTYRLPVSAVRYVRMILLQCGYNYLLPVNAVRYVPMILLQRGYNYLSPVSAVRYVPTISLQYRHTYCPPVCQASSQNVASATLDRSTITCQYCQVNCYYSDEASLNGCI